MKKCLLFATAFLLCTQAFAQEDTTTTAVTFASLSFFQVQSVDKVVQLKWSVEHSEDFKCFEIERADNGDNFMKVGSKLAITKSSDSDYDFVDATPRRNVPLRYRLKLVAKDGFISYSTFQEVKVVDAQISVRLKQNPVRSTVEVELSSTTAKQASVTIVSQAGQQVASQTFRLTTGVNHLSVSAQTMLQGLYQLVVEAGNERKVISFIKE